MSKKKVIKEEPVLPLYIFFTIGKAYFMVNICNQNMSAKVMDNKYTKLAEINKIQSTNLSASQQKKFSLKPKLTQRICVNLPKFNKCYCFINQSLLNANTRAQSHF